MTGITDSNGSIASLICAPNGANSNIVNAVHRAGVGLAQTPEDNALPGHAPVLGLQAGIGFDFGHAVDPHGLSGADNLTITELNWH